MRKKVFLFGLALVLLGVALFVADRFFTGILLIFLGAFTLLILFVIAVSAQPIVTYGDSSLKKSDKPNEKIFVAWSNKHEGLKSIIEETKGLATKYGGMDNKEIVEHLKNHDDELVWEYPVQRGSDLYFRREPDNKYNDEAIEIYSISHGKLGYVPDKNLDYINRIIAKPPEGLVIEWALYGGNAKGIGLNNKVYTESFDKNLYIELFY